MANLEVYKVNPGMGFAKLATKSLFGKHKGLLGWWFKSCTVFDNLWRKCSLRWCIELGNGSLMLYCVAQTKTYCSSVFFKSEIFLAFVACMCIRTVLIEPLDM